jgi:protein-disulfide isomerase
MIRAALMTVAFSLLALTGIIPSHAQTGTNKLADLYLGGHPNAQVVIDVFSDYQCPACRAFYLETLKPLVSDYTKANKIDKIYIKYHDFPLEMHPYARKAAKFALAAMRISRDRWLRVTDVLYTEQEKWASDGNIEAVLAKALDQTELIRIQSLAANPAIDAALNQEIQLGQSQNVTSTPTFFISSQSGRQQRVTNGVALIVLKDFLDRLIG